MSLEAVDTVPTGTDCLARDYVQWFRELDRGTGEEARRSGGVYLYSSVVEALGNFVSLVTGYRQVGDETLNAFVQVNEALQKIVTGDDPVDAVNAWIEAMAGPLEEAREAAVRPMGRATTMTPAARLRQLSGLDAGRLADVFDVSRPTYQQWISGSTPRSGHLDHLLQALPLMQEAAEYLGGSDPTCTWLLTPVAPAAPRPIDFLAQHRFEAFRGSLHRTPAESRMISQPRAFGQRRRPSSRAELEDALQRISPRVWQDDDSE